MGSYLCSVPKWPDPDPKQSALWTPLLWHQFPQRLSPQTVWDHLWRAPCRAVPTLLSSPLLLLQACPLLSGSRPEMLPLMCLLPSLPRATLCCWLLEAVRGKDSPQLPGLPCIPYFLNSSANQHLPGVIPPLLSHTLQKTPSAKCELMPEWDRLLLSTPRPQHSHYVSKVSRP